MIKFFRKIRKNLLMENNTGKYFKYAIGEILLVVIGILIALWINNVYQGYKNEKLATVYLIDFKEDLVADTLALAERTSLNKNFIKNIDTILYTLANMNELSDKQLLKFANLHISIMRESYFIPEKITLRQFESNNGGHLISSKLLKDRLFRYYTLNERYEKNIETSVQLFQHSFFTRDFMQTIISGRFFKLIAGSSLNRRELDLKKLTNNDDYISSLIHKRGISEEQNTSYQKIKSLATELINIINAELEREN